MIEAIIFITIELVIIYFIFFYKENFCKNETIREKEFEKQFNTKELEKQLQVLEEIQEENKRRFL